VLETVKIRRAGFASRLTFEQFYYRYRVLSSQKQSSDFKVDFSQLVCISDIHLISFLESRGGYSESELTRASMGNGKDASHDEDKTGETAIFICSGVLWAHILIRSTHA